MKIKGFIISGILLCCIGGGLTIYATTREDFDYKNAYVDPTLEERQKDLGIVSSIHYEGSVEQLIIQTGEEASISYFEGKHTTYEITEDEATKGLTIIQKRDSFWHQFGGGTGANKPMVITIPNPLADMYIELAAGTITIKNITTASSSIDLDAGSVLKENVNEVTSTTKVNAGDIVVKDSTCGDAKLDVAAGDIQFSGLVLSSLDAKVNCGFIELNLENIRDLCKINGEGNGLITINYDVDAGDSKVSFKE